MNKFLKALIYILVIGLLVGVIIFFARCASCISCGSCGGSSCKGLSSCTGVSGCGKGSGNGIGSGGTGGGTNWHYPQGDDTGSVNADKIVKIPTENGQEPIQIAVVVGHICYSKKADKNNLVEVTFPETASAAGERVNFEVKPVNREVHQIHEVYGYYRTETAVIDLGVVKVGDGKYIFEMPAFNKLVIRVRLDCEEKSSVNLPPLPYEIKDFKDEQKEPGGEPEPGGDPNEPTEEDKADKKEYEANESESGIKVKVVLVPRHVNSYVYTAGESEADKVWGLDEAGSCHHGFKLDDGGYPETSLYTCTTEMVRITGRENPQLKIKITSKDGTKHSLSGERIILLGIAGTSDSTHVLDGGNEIIHGSDGEFFINITDGLYNQKLIAEKYYELQIEIYFADELTPAEQENLNAYRAHLAAGKSENESGAEQ